MSDNSLIQTENLGATLALMSRRYSDSRKASEIDWTGSFENYCELVSKKPGLARNAYQRLYDMIMLEGTEMRKSRFVRRQVPHYFFFDDKEHGGAQAIFGIDFNLDIMMKQVESASRGYGQERRAFLLLGPVGSAKSTIASRLKAGLEAYSYIPDGALHSFSWKSQAYFGFTDPERTKKFYDGEWFGCPMREDPLKLIPMQEREVFLKSLGITNYEHLMTELCPACFHVYEKLLKQYDGDFLRMIRENIQVERFTLSEARRVGIATFQPKDEKNQDSTELTGEVSNRNEVI
ncbi:MAG: serine protein kinase, partial [Nanoarchaeota archaeon]